MQTAAISLRIRTQLLAVDIILASQSIDVAKRIPKCTRAGNIDHRPIGVCQRKRAEPPYLTRAPSTILNELIYVSRLVDLGNNI